MSSPRASPRFRFLGASTADPTALSSRCLLDEVVVAPPTFSSLSVPRWAWEQARLDSASNTSDSDDSGSSSKGIGRRMWRRRRREQRRAGLPNFRTTAELRRIFRSAVLAIICLHRLTESALRRQYESIQATVADFLADGKVKIKRGGHVFDPDAFKARQTAVSLSSAAKQTLRLPPARRKNEHFQAVIYELRSYAAFAAYPIHVQEKIARNGWFEEFGPYKVLVRQGHVPVNFFFLLKGSVTVNKVEEDPSSFGPVNNTLCSGSQFGELDILERKRRTETVVAKEHIEVLTVDRQVLRDIGGWGSHHHIDFIRKLTAFRHWPVDLFLAFPSKCEMHYFRRGAVIVKSSALSETVYVVKSGSCDVVKKLKWSHSAIVNRMHEFKRQQRKYSLPCLGLGAEKQRRGSVDYHLPSVKRNSTRKSSCSSAEDKPLTRHFSSVDAIDFSVARKTSPSNHEEEFIHLDTLKPRDVFGVAAVSKDGETECSLVSNGAECVMIPRKFLLDYADTFARQDLERVTKTYPTDEQLHTVLRKNLKWEEYKSKTVRSIINSNSS
eukprot:m.69895 g.69895  ORF g.69895 m.69895 type:complete len:553 (+) comp35647_c0_seq2:30-1688(+)